MHNIFRFISFGLESFGERIRVAINNYLFVISLTSFERLWFFINPWLFFSSFLEDFSRPPSPPNLAQTPGHL